MLPTGSLGTRQKTSLGRTFQHNGHFHLSQAQPHTRATRILQQSCKCSSAACSSRSIAASTQIGWSHSRPASKLVTCRARRNDSATDSSSGVEVINPPRDGKLESTRLKESTRKQVEAAIEELGARVTVGDVAAKAGVSIQEAEEALNALTADSLGSIQVSATGDALYVLPNNFKAVISGRSWMLRIAPVLAGIKDAGAYLVRISFGAALLTSVALVWISIFAILSSGSDRDDRDRRGSYSGGYYYQPRSSFVFWDASDLLWFRSRRQLTTAQTPPQEMSFLESVFSFVFGDGDPNVDFEEKRWQMVGRYIQSKGGVVTAEELAPFLDPPPRVGDELDESYVVPALVRFGGSPEVDERGNLLYRFESLQRSGGGSARASGEPVALQNLWEQTRADRGQKLLASGLGALNVAGVAVLSGLLRSPSVMYQLGSSSLGFVLGLMPILQVYAASFFLIPALRWVLNRQRNSQVKEANRLRLERLRELRQPSSALQQKLLSAQQQARRTVIRDKDIIYRSDRNLDDQKDLDAAEFDRRLQDLDESESQKKQLGGRDYSDWAARQKADVDVEWR